MSKKKEFVLPRVPQFFGKYELGSALARDPATLSLLSSQDDAWNLYAGAMKNFIAGGAEWSNLQLVSPSRMAEKLEWDDPEFGDYYFHKVAADLMPGPGATYNRTDKSFAERYGAFITDISRKPVDPAALEEMLKAGTQLVDYDTVHNQMIDNLNLEWQTFDTRQRNSLPPSRWMSFDDWWQRFAATKVMVSQENRLAYFANFEYWVQKAFQGRESLAKILNDFRDPSKQVFVNIPKAGNTILHGGKLQVYPYLISEDYSKWLSQAKAGSLARTTLNINRSTFRSDVSQSDIAGGAGVFCGFFGAFALGERTTVQIDTSSEAFSMSFDAVFKTFEIYPATWYNSDAFDLFRDGPFYPDSPMDHLHKSNALFGPRGFLNFKPIRAVVAYNPKVSITMDKNNYHYFDQQTRGFGAFCIGPFIIGGGSYYDRKTQVYTSSDNYSFGFEIKDYAVLIAFDYQDI